MKICLFSDLHAHPYSNGSILEHGSNSRVLDAVSVIEQVYLHAKDIGAAKVLFGGDLFDRRKSIDVDTYNKVHSTVLDGSYLSVGTILLVGNHDQANRSGTIHALDRFESRVEQQRSCYVADEPRWWKVTNPADPEDVVGLFTVPYYDDGEVIASHIEDGIDNRPEWAEKAMLLIHYGLSGAKVGPGDYIVPCELSLSMLHPDKWDIIFSGHYHIGQQLGSKFHYIGSAMQHRWDDAGFDKSFVVLDTDDFSITRVPTVAPKFVVAERKFESLEFGNVDNAFVRVVTSYDMEDDEKVKIEKELKDLGAISVEFRFEKPDLVSHEERISLSEDRGVFGIVEDYVNSDAIDTTDFDVDKLISVGKNILSAVAN